MFKIIKCITPGRILPLGGSKRLRTNRACNNEVKYECKQPEPDDTDLIIERIKKKHTPPLFGKKHSKDIKNVRAAVFFVCLPIVFCHYLYICSERKKLRKRPKFVDFTYLRIRKKPFPWDPVRTFFHNPRYNALPDGYEFEVPEDEEYDPFEGPG